MTFVHTAGQRHETTRLAVLMEQCEVKRVGRGRGKLRPKRLLGDKASSSRKSRRYVKRRGIAYTLPRRSDETAQARLTEPCTKSANPLNAGSIV
jgi:hypothetical protein